MLQQRVQNPPHTERRFNHGGRELNLVDLLRRLFPSDHFLGNLKSVHCGLPLGLQRRGDRLEIGPILRQRLQRVRHHALIRLERLPQRLPVKLELGHLDLPCLVQLERRHHGRLRRLAVHVQVVARPVGVAHALHPTVGALNFQVPAVACVVRHFRGQVLTEAQAGRIHADPLHEELRPRHEVGEGFVVHHTHRHCLTRADCFGFSRAELIVTTE
mmetsp:Transcript_37892/g.80938  ORF Transcript_37892/g.80938 Transcript_37892/m.80938 type:complete len:215 (-) Transcript_37892:1047-1691(-)